MNGYQIIQVAQGSKGGYHLSFYLSCVMWSDLNSYNWPFILITYPDFGFGGQWSSCRKCFWQNQLLTVTLWPHSFSYPVQVMILMGSYWVFNLASTSVDGCCLYIIINNGMSWWSWGVRLAPWWGRSATKFLKVVDAHACNNIIPRNSMQVPGVLGIFLWGRVLPPWTPAHIKWQNWLPLARQMSVKLWNGYLWHIC